MKKLMDLVTVTGELVKNGIEEFEHEGVEKIGGILVLRTADDSEHEINFSSTKYKKDENKNFTSEESYFYKKYLDAMNNLKDILSIVKKEKNPILFPLQTVHFQ